MARPLDSIVGRISPGAIPPVDLHMHTDWTDGSAPVAVMHGRAVELGLSTILFSEHARRSSGDWFPRFAAEVRAVSDGRCRALVGVECKIDGLDGAVDSSPDILGLCDLVMASVHRFPGEVGTVTGSTGGYTPDQAVRLEFDLSMAAMDNPAVDILGHPFAMSISRFGATPPWELFLALMEKSAATGVAFEVNARYHPDPWALVNACAALGTPVSLGSNAHNPDEVGRITRLLQGRSP